MKQFSSAGRGLALACTLVLCGSVAQAQDDATVGKAVAQKQASDIKAGDPSRWHKDDAGSQAALKTVRKEVGAAYDEAQRACARGPAAERPACLQAAGRTWQEDMKNAPAQVAAARDMGSVTTTTTRTTGTVSTTITKIESATENATEGAATEGAATKGAATTDAVSR